MNKTDLYDSDGAREIDRRAIAADSGNGFALMNAAGQAAFAHLEQALDNREQAKILVLCGAGNNGGDGYVVARCALERGWQVTLLASKEPQTDDAKHAKQQWLEQGGQLTTLKQLQDKPQRFDAIVDGLLGIGLESPPRGTAAELIEFANAQSGFKLALDLPSGVNADSGFAYSPCFKANLSVTFIANKVGLNTGSALNYLGELVLEPLDVDQQHYDAVNEQARIIEPEFKERLADSHKGSYGHALIAGAADGMLGAGILAGQAALRTGCGKATLLSTERHLDQAALSCPELMSAVFVEQIPQSLIYVDAVAVGPGLGAMDWSKQLLAAALQLDKPTLVDADALILLANQKIDLPEYTVVTPHPGEAASLLGCPTADIQEDRLAAARAIASEYAAVCVLKGAGSVVASPAGEVFICNKGNPAMASAGMGDVLSGVIVALLAQGYSVLQAAKTGVWWHAAVADQLVERQRLRSLLASDVAQAMSADPLTIFN